MKIKIQQISIYQEKIKTIKKLQKKKSSEFRIEEIEWEWYNAKWEWKYKIKKNLYRNSLTMITK